MLEHALKLGHPYYASKSLDSIHETLRAIAKGGHVRPDADDIRSFTQVLERVPTDHAVVVQPIKKLLATSWAPTE